MRGIHVIKRFSSRISREASAHPPSYSYRSAIVRATSNNTQNTAAMATSTIFQRPVPRTKITKDASVLKSKDASTDAQAIRFPRRIFSGIQPTGSLHIGNYLGAVRRWVQLQESKEDVTFCIVDMHAITLPQDPLALRENILRIAATLLACGIDPQRSKLFVQSAVKEHAEFSWILNCMTTMARLGHLPQYKEKTRAMKEVPLGLFVYPVLQAADIMLYKATHVPVGEDQAQHIQLTQHLTRTFNTRYGETFPVCHAMIEGKASARVRSLRDPTKKMSKSDGDPKSIINLLDEPDVIVEKVKKAVTDFTSDVTYAPETRLGISNLVAIHALMAGKPTERIVEEATGMDTGRYKLVVAEAIVEYLKPIRLRVNELLSKEHELLHILELGAERARQVAHQTMYEVKQRTGLGAHYMPALAQPNRERNAKPEIVEKVRDAKQLGVREYMTDTTQAAQFKQRSEIRLQLKPLFNPQSQSQSQPQPPLKPATLASGSDSGSKLPIKVEFKPNLMRINTQKSTTLLPLANRLNKSEPKAALMTFTKRETAPMPAPALPALKFKL